MVIPPGYTVGRVWRMLFAVAIRSRRFRAFGYALPRSRVRTRFVGAYYHLMFEQFRDGNLGFVATVSDHAQFTLFGLETYRGREGVGKGLMAWREMFPTPIFELVEFVNPPDGDVFCCVRMGGAGVRSGISVEDVSYFVVRVEGGMATQGAVYRDRSDALKAAAAMQPL
jgi:hypothetical protein